jgi:hypothetical protein
MPPVYENVAATAAPAVRVNGYQKGISPDALWLLDAKTGKPVATSAPAVESADALAFSGDGTKLAILTSPKESDKWKSMDFVLLDLTKLPKQSSAK